MLTFEEQKIKIKKSIWESFLTSILFLIFAFILLFKEEDILSTFIIAMGFLGIVFGLLYFPIYFRLSKDSRIYSNELLKGIVFFLFGGIAILKNEILSDMVAIVIGAYLIYKNAYRTQICFSLDKGDFYWKCLTGLSIICIFLGVFILLNPLEGKISLSLLLSVCVIVSEGISLIQSIAILIGLGKKYESVKETE